MSETSQSLRIVWVAPWFSTLSSIWADGLRALGHRVVVITTPMHFDPPPAHADDIVLTHPWRSGAGMREFAAARAALARFGADIVVTEIARDPRFLALAHLGVPIVFTTHDAVPHDAANAVPLLRGLSTRRLTSAAAAEVVFSRAVANRLPRRAHPVHVVGLTGDLRAELVPAVVPAGERRDFLLIGRLSEYKNIPNVVAGYERHRASAAYRGDQLVIVGAGDPGCALPDHVEWIDERFSFVGLSPRLAQAKASLCVYSAASQSGVQVLSMQCGTAVIVSEAGGLAEYLPDGETPVRHDDIAAIAEAFDRLADPDLAARMGRQARATYEARYSVTVTSQQWEDVLIRTLRRGAGVPAPERREFLRRVVWSR